MLVMASHAAMAEGQDVFLTDGLQAPSSGGLTLPTAQHDLEKSALPMQGLDASEAFPQDAMKFASHRSQTCTNAGCCECNCSECCPSGRWLTTAEIVVLDYDREQGTRVGGTPAEIVDWGLEISPRLTLAWLGTGRSGIRGRWWMFDHHETPVSNEPNSFLEVDTYTADIEYFKLMPLTPRWSADFSLGCRYNSFEETMEDRFPLGQPQGPVEFRQHAFDGIGPTIGLETQWSIFYGLTVYARVRGSFLWGDMTRINSTLVSTTTEQFTDSTQTILESGAGVELCRPLCGSYLMRLRFGFEYQSWYNYSSDFLALDNANESIWTNRTDVNFIGFNGGLGIEF